MSVLLALLWHCFFSASHPNVQYVADFAPELGMIIMETKYLEQLGFQVPELARNVALQVNYHVMNKRCFPPFNFCLEANKYGFEAGEAAVFIF